MSWLVSLIVAGMMFTYESSQPPTAQYNFTESKTRVERKVNPDETERFEQTYPLSANGRVSISNVNGSINVETWERNEVKLEYVKTGDTKENLAEVEIRIDARADAFTVETDYGDWKRKSSGERKNYGKLQVEYRLTVPRTAVLNEIETVNGSVSITGAGNSTKASSVNGQVRATNLRGATNLSTVNGTVDAEFDQLATGSRISLDTVNGTVNLVIPSDSNATVKADTLNGLISNDFGLPIRKGEYVGRDLYGRIGSGDVQIRLNSVNGGLAVKRKNDGKSVNPATNLLTTKTEDNSDDDEDSDNRASVRAPRAPRSPRPPRTPRVPTAPAAPISPTVPTAPTAPIIDHEEINRSIKESLKAAQAEIDNIKPELDKINAEALKQVAANIDTKQLNEQIRQAQEKYREAMVGMANVNWSAGTPSIEEKSESFTVKGTPKVTVDAKMFPVTVRGWDKSEVRYSVTRISRNQSQTPLDLRATQKDSDVNIDVTNDNGTANRDFFNEANRVRIELFVPRKANLKIKTGGAIRLEGVTGEIDLQGAGESINVRDAGGKLSVGTADGKIRVIGFKGEINTQTSSGATDLEGEFRGLSARTVDGTIILTLPENANASIESNRKDVAGEGISLVQQANGRDASSWKIGSGGEKYLLYAAEDGRVIIRGAKQLQN